MKRGARNASVDEGNRDEIDRLNDQARASVSTDLRRALAEATSASELAAGAGYVLGRARALRTIGECHGRLAAPDAARTALEEAIALFQAEGDLGGE